jgi:hypothetical protein
MRLSKRCSALGRCVVECPVEPVRKPPVRYEQAEHANPGKGLNPLLGTLSEPVKMHDHGGYQYGSTAAFLSDRAARRNRRRKGESVGLEATSHPRKVSLVGNSPMISRARVHAHCAETVAARAARRQGSPNSKDPHLGKATPPLRGTDQPAQVPEQLKTLPWSDRRETCGSSSDL